MLAMRTFWRAHPKLKIVIGTVLLIVPAFVGGMFFGASRTGLLAAAAAYRGVTPIGAPEDVDFAPVWRAWNVINERYVPGHIATSTASTTPNGFTDNQERVWGMIQGLAASLQDPYTVFLPPSDAEIFESDISGAFEGVGMEIAIRDGVLTVVSPMKGTPASRAGIKAADIIAKIDGQTTENMGVDEAIKLIRGPKGSVVKLLVYREGGSAEGTTISITRDVINIPAVDSLMRDDGVFVITIYSFSAVSPDKFREALQQFIDSGSHRLIVDLRGNPGGYLQAAVDIGSWFLPEGTIIVTEDYGTRAKSVPHRSIGYNIFTNELKMAILVDKGSASASEILAGALRHHGKAKLIGATTFGKGSVQELVNITPETALKITVARWLGPDGEQIPTTGIKPDIEVIPSEADIKAGRDVQMERAAKELLK